MKEIWRNIDGYDISNLGNCKQNYSKHQNYFRTTDGNEQLIHILVAKAFPEICGKWFEGCVVHHLNHNTIDNNAENLKVCTRGEHFNIHRKDNTLKRKLNNPNNEMWYRIADTKRKNGTLHNSSKLTNIGMFKEDVLINTFNNVYEAHTETGVNAITIRRCLNNKIKSAGGYIWKLL